MTDELNWVNGFNDRINRIREIVEGARPHVAQLVGDLVATSLDRPIASAQVRSWRERANVKVASDAGFAYESYVRLKLSSVRSFVSGLIAAMRGVSVQSLFARAIAEIIDAWAIETGRVYGKASDDAMYAEAAAAGQEVPLWMKFLLAFDVDYRKRRLHFMIEGQNRLYQDFDQPHFNGYDRALVDRLKRSFYDQLDVLNRFEDVAIYSPATRDLVADLFAVPPTSEERPGPQAICRRCSPRRRRDGLDLLVHRISVEIDLAACTDDLDTLLASSNLKEWSNT